MAFHQCRHPLLGNGKTVIRNDVLMDPSTRLQLIHGPNMSGKTTYMNQIALIVIMGQMGCFVPCSYASIRLTSRILSRIGRDNSLNVFVLI